MVGEECGEWVDAREGRRRRGSGRFCGSGCVADERVCTAHEPRGLALWREPLGKTCRGREAVKCVRPHTLGNAPRSSTSQLMASDSPPAKRVRIDDDHVALRAATRIGKSQRSL